MTKGRLPETWRGGEAMKRLTVNLDDEFYADLKELARRKATTMADLVRFAVDKTFENALDVIAGERAYEEHLQDPSLAVPLDEFLKERGIALSKRARKPRASQPAASSSKASATNSAGRSKSGGPPIS